jgi:uncharacterized protein (TIGR02117 family)
MRWLKRTLIAFLAVAAALLALAYLFSIPENPDLKPAAGAGIAVAIADHGYHAGLILPREELLRAAEASGSKSLITILARFEPFPWIEIGWGDEGFYRNVPAFDLAAVPEIARALFSSGNVSVLHVVGLDLPPREFFPVADILTLHLSEEGLSRMAAEIERTAVPAVGGPPVELGAGLYGPSLFFRANGFYHAANNCNQWIARLIGSAGAPVSLLPATLSAGLLADLRLRAEAWIEPAPVQPKVLPSDVPVTH